MGIEGDVSKNETITPKKLKSIIGKYWVKKDDDSTLTATTTTTTTNRASSKLNNNNTANKTVLDKGRCDNQHCKISIAAVARQSIHNIYTAVVGNNNKDKGILVASNVKVQKL